MKKLMKTIVLVLAILLMSGETGIQQVFAEEVSQEIPEGYIPIYDIEDLYAIRNDLSGNYILMNDIDLSEATSEGGDYDCGTGWDSIEEFSGVLDGNGYRIIGMHIFGEFTIADVAYFGLFEQLDEATIKNLGLVDCDIDIVVNDKYSQYSYWVGIGAIAGESYGDVENCYTSGNIKVSGENEECYIGGLLGRVPGGNMQNCYNACRIDCSNAENKMYAGGILGWAIYSSSYDVVNTYNIGQLIGNDTSALGGICGKHGAGGSIENSFYLRGTATQGCGILERNRVDNCVSLSEAQMKNSKIFTGFDFDTVWEIDPYCTYPYPQLRNNRMVRVSSIVLQSEPSKRVYYQGDKLDITDAVLEITYEDEIKPTIPVTTDMLSGYDMNEIGVQTVTVSYGGLKTEFEIEVKEVPVTNITIPNAISIYRSKMQQLNAVVLPANTSDKTVTWESDNPTVASVNSNGLINAKARGTAIITATTANGLKAQCEVTVLVAAVSVTLNNTSVTLKEGESTTLTAQILPLESTDTVEWMTSNAGVVEVYDGTVVAKAAGVATITAYTESGTKAECTVTVQKVQTAPETQTPQTPNTDDDGQKKEDTGIQSTLPEVGTQRTVSDGVYKITKSSATNKEVTFTQPKNSKKTSITIPATIKIDGQTYKVTEVAAKAFKNNKKLKSVTIGKNVKKIGKEAFSGCNKVKKITIKSSVLKSVGKNAIKGIDERATIKCPKKQLSAYKKLFKSKTGYKNTMKIKK